MQETLILDGKKVARAIRNELSKKVADLKSKGVFPKLTIVLVGNDPPSLIYVANKEKACQQIGVEVEKFHLAADVSREMVKEAICRCNDDKGVHGIILQLPLPGHLDADELIETINPEKDVDGLTAANLGRLLQGRPRYIPATPAGIIELLGRYSITTAGRHVVIVGRGELVGKPLANLLLFKGERGDATVTVCHSKTPNLAAICRSAEILIVAAGKPGLINDSMVNMETVVVDAGINRTENGIVGDVDFNRVAPKVRAITPVPGGVGPMTVAMLLSNTVQAAKRLTQRP